MGPIFLVACLCVGVSLGFRPSNQAQGRRNRHQARASLRSNANEEGLQAELPAALARHVTDASQAVFEGGESDVMSLIQLNQPEEGEAEESQLGEASDMCAVCTYVLSNHEQGQPYTCRGLKTPEQQRAVSKNPAKYRPQLGIRSISIPSKFAFSHTSLQCVKSLESIIWALRNVVYWETYGCKKKQGDQAQWIKPCTPDAMCSWLVNLDDASGETLCPPSDRFEKPV